MTAHNHIDGAKVHRLRKALGLTLEQLGETTGMSTSFVCDIEKGRKNQPSLHNAIRLAHTLGVTIEELLENTTMTTPSTEWYETRINHLERKIDAYKADVRLAEQRALIAEQTMLLADAAIAASQRYDSVEFARQRTAYLNARRGPNP